MPGESLHLLRRREAVTFDTTMQFHTYLPNEIGKAVLAQRLKENPDVLAQLSALLAQRQLETEGVLAAGKQGGAAQAQQTRYTAGFVDKLRRFFEL